jgi:hypothetical protein
MAKPLTADNWVAALERWKIPFAEEAGWRSRANGGGWGDVQGFMVHHTGDDAPDTADLKVVRDGHAGLSGPLCNAGLEDSGLVRLVAAGAANHAGGGDAAVLRAMIAGKALPAPRYTHAQLGDYVDAIIGNPRFAGVECFYYLKDSPAQRAMMPLLVAAWIDGMNRQNGTTWGGNRLIGHKEWQRGKIDPKLFGSDTMDKMRAECAAYLEAGPDGGFLMALTEAQQDRLYKDTIETNDRVMAFLSQRYYVMDKANPRKAVPVSVDTEGRRAARALDTLDGNYLALGQTDLGEKIATVEGKVEGLIAGFKAFAEAGGSDADLAGIAEAVDAAVNKAFDERVKGVQIDMEATPNA